MQVLLKNRPVLDIQENGVCRVLDFDRLPFALRKENITFVDFIEWASNRTLSIGRSYAKEILNSLRLSQTNRFAVCKACRGLSLEDSYWLRQDDDDKSWEEVNLFRNPLSLFVTEISLSGSNIHFTASAEERRNIHTPELTTLGASAKGWIRQEGKLYLHKVGKYEIPADQILNVLDIPHIHYRVSAEKEISDYISEERKEWIRGVGEAVVNSELFTSEPFSNYENVMSQTTECDMTLKEAAVGAQKELGMNLDKLDDMEQPQFLSAVQWDAVLDRKCQLSGTI